MMLVLDKKEQFKTLEIAMKSDDGDLIGGYFILPNGAIYQENIVLMTVGGHFSVWSDIDVVAFAHGYQGNIICEYDDIDLANKIFDKLKRLEALEKLQ